MLVEFKNVTKTYDPCDQLALKDVSLSVSQGEFVCIIGPSGEGKSTILKLIAGLEKQNSGEVVGPEKVSMAFQSVALLPWLTVLENIMLVLQSGGQTIEQARRHATIYIEMMKLGHTKDKRPVDLSGGERQRVGIARALAVRPHVLLLDEPFSALDPKITAELHDDLIEIWKREKLTIVMVSHLIEEAVSLAQKIFLIKKYKLAHTFHIDLPYPRREHAEHFTHEVNNIRREFFK
jgi:NitT/TauT family transport system ATP-binding protein